MAKLRKVITLGPQLIIFCHNSAHVKLHLISTLQVIELFAQTLNEFFSMFI